MKILAIETSCDDTGIAVVRASKKSGFKILSDIISSQIKIHKKWGGVYPTLAKREHQRNLVSVLKKALENAKMLKRSQIPMTNDQTNPKFQFLKLKKILEREEYLYKKLEKFLNKYQKPDVDLIAVTIGPGLEPCLWVGINFAKALSCWWDIPIVPVNHIEAHIFVNFLNKKNYRLQVTGYRLQELFPAITLIVSGGHTQLILMKDIGNYKILGETKDDAAGECFDKTAKILGLEYPGGPAISRLASQYKATRGRASGKSDKNKIARGRASGSLPRPMINTNDYDFSFSGLKTAVLYHVKKNYPKATRLRSASSKITARQRKYIQEMAYEIQQAIIDVLIKKTIKAAKDYKVKTIILGGGVSSNDELRRQFLSKVYGLEFKVNFLVPPKNLCTDNAVMTAVAGYYNWLRKKTKPWQKIEAKANLVLK